MINKIDILYIVGEPIGGIRKHIHDLINYGILKNFNIGYFYSSVAQDSTFKKEISNYDKSNVSINKLKIKKLPGILDLYNLIVLIRFVHKHKPRIIHGHGAKGGVYARIVGMFSRDSKTVYTPHGGSLHENHTLLAGSFYIAVEKLLSRVTSFFVFESMYTANQYETLVGPLCKNKYLINHNGVKVNDISTIDLRLHRKVVKIAVIGALRALKGQMIFLRALEIMQRAGFDMENISGYIIGDGIDRLDLENHCKSNNLEFVKFTGDVTNINEWIDEMDIVVIPSLYESFGYVAIEAMSRGVFVIAANTGGLREVVKKPIGMLFKAQDPESLAKMLKQSILEVDEIRALRNQIYDYCKNNFNLMDKMKSTYGVYNILLK